MARASPSRLRSRTVVRVSCPAARSWIKQWVPTNPVPPVTKTRAIMTVLQPIKRCYTLNLSLRSRTIHADRGPLEKNEDLNLAHSLLRKARRASEADPQREWLSDLSGHGGENSRVDRHCATIGFFAE